VSPKTAIVILNWNGRAFLEEFLPSVTSFSKGARIIVADNASTDDSIAFLKEYYPDVELVINESNGGFAKGYNDALKSVDSEYFLLLNSDIEVTDGWLEPLEKALENAEIAGCQPKILAQKRKTHFEHAGASGGFIDKNYYPFCRGRILSDVEQDEGQYNEQTDIFWATGACFLVRSEVYHEMGGFDEDFFAHMEEIDLCWRIKRMGHRIVVVPESTVYHVGGGTLSYQSPRKTFLNFRNNLFMILKNHEGFLPTRIFGRLCLDGMAACLFLLKLQFGNFWAVFKSHMAFYVKLRTMLRKRKALKRQIGDRKMNRSGMYKGSILWGSFLGGKKKFSDLDSQRFQ